MFKDIDRFVAWIFQLLLRKCVSFCCTRPMTVLTTLIVLLPGSFHCTCRSSSSFGSPWTSSWPWNGGFEHPVTSSWPWNGGSEETIAKKHEESKINCRARGRGGNNRQKMEEGKTSCQGHNCTQKPGQVKITST